MVVFVALIIVTVGSLVFLCQYLKPSDKQGQKIDHVENLGGK